MTSILHATPNDARLLSVIGRQSLIESHGHSASEKDINYYLDHNMSEEAYHEELIQPENIYHIIYADGRPAGYSKIIFDAPYPGVQAQNITKLSRIYILKEFYGQEIGKDLFSYILDLSKQHHQAGMWLNVWTENHRAINFYLKQGFEIIGSHDFEVSPTHFNPNHVMYLKYK
ncbi:MAG: GNAT family N-acetyltransferase [Saprospiraceae bacterium]